MNTFKTTSELKAIAKGLLIGKYKTVITAFLIIEISILLVESIVSSLTDTTTFYGIIIYYAIVLILQLIAAIFSLGNARLYLNISCNCPYAANDVFYGFKQSADKAIKVCLMILLREIACLLPAFLCYVMYLNTGNAFLLLFTSLFGVIGGISVCIISLTYSQVYFLILDFPQHSATEIMRICKNLTKGYKGHLFYLTVSFIPMLLLALFTCCVGYLWVIPYINATNTQFYLELIRIKSAPVANDSSNSLI